MASNSVNNTASASIASSSGNVSGTASVNSQTSVAAINARPSHMSQLDTEMKVLDKKSLDELVREVDPLEQLDEEVEEVLYQIADDFIDSIVTSSCQLAKHRKSSTLEVKDIQLNLERNWNMWIPGYGSSEDHKQYKKSLATEAHKQRMALIKKTLKKF